MSNKIQLRRDTEENWTNNNPVLAAGELALSTDTDPPKLKVGDGSTAWSSLTYITGTSGGSGSPGGSNGQIQYNNAGSFGGLDTATYPTITELSYVKGVTSSIQTQLNNKANVEWTRVVLGSDFSTTNATNTNITGLSFTPTADRVYYIEVYLLLRTATNTVGARPGISFPSNLLDSGAWMQAPNSATASAQRWWGNTSTANAASTGLGDTVNSWMAIGGAMLVCGPSTSGNFQITLASETAGTAVTAKQYSFLRYREI